MPRSRLFLHNRVSQLWHRLPIAARVCVLVWASLGLLGLARLAAAAPLAVRNARLGDERQRQAIYAPTYDFGIACAPHLAPTTSLALVDPSYSESLGVCRSENAV